ncbi:sulfotransferase [Stigmatella sp. ncwal1]|uniref:Sulfotransferase n=1 Tax=Stigmatella ashevillensis TaxID=2995309 RepID=A0ABT5DJG3_9BACT|nr:sulfotransferase [Stigmatella ashevillena]MDC0713789.1 sulfotransferase [Stigmatella ashevillena]
MKLFLIGTSRSGSNMLRLMMNQAADIHAPHPPLFMERMRPFQAGFGDLTQDANFDALLESACRLVETNHVPWDIAPLDRAEVRAMCRSRDVVGVYDALMSLSAQRHGKGSWLCKASSNVHFLPEIEQHFGEDAYFLHLVRDGRDVLTSYLRVLVGEKTTYHVGYQWALEQQLCLALQKRTPSRRYLSVRYEDLLADPRQHLSRVCDWLGISFRPEMVAFNESDEAQKTADCGQMWANVKKPLMQDNTQKWKSELSAEQILMFELVAGEMLRHHGYELSLAGSLQATASPADVMLLDHVNNRMKALVLARIPQRDLDIRAPQDEVIRQMIRATPNVEQVELPIGSVVLPLWKDVLRERQREADHAGV